MNSVIFQETAKLKKPVPAEKSYRTLRKITGTFQSFKKISSKTS